MRRVLCRLSPNLALVKYWGKRPRGLNLPATPSLGLALGGLETVTVGSLRDAGEDRLEVDGAPQTGSRIEAFFDSARALLGTERRFELRSRSSFPASAGLASSSSGFAALALVLARLLGADGDEDLVAELARRGSASAARALVGGFCWFPAGARRAGALCPPEHWPDLRVLAALVTRSPKLRSSRDAMADTAATSPYYRGWVRDASRLAPEARQACLARDLEGLGRAMRLSYSRMHAALLAADPPRCYWLPETLALIAVCADLRAAGVEAFETIDAGPQVKVLCREGDLPRIRAALEMAVPRAEFLVASPGAGPRLLELSEHEPDPLAAGELR